MFCLEKKERGVHAYVCMYAHTHRVRHSKQKEIIQKHKKNVDHSLVTTESEWHVTWNAGTVCTSLAIKNVILSFSLGSLMASPSRRNVLGAATIWVHRAAQVSLSHPVRPMEKPVGPLRRTTHFMSVKGKSEEERKKDSLSSADWYAGRQVGGKGFYFYLAKELNSIIPQLL